MVYEGTKSVNLTREVIEQLNKNECKSYKELFNVMKIKHSWIDDKKIWSTIRVTCSNLDNYSKYDWDKKSFILKVKSNEQNQQ